MGHQKTGTDFVPYYTDFTEIGEVFQTTYQGTGGTAPIFYETQVYWTPDAYIITKKSENGRISRQIKTGKFVYTTESGYPGEFLLNSSHVDYLTVASSDPTGALEKITVSKYPPGTEPTKEHEDDDTRLFHYADKDENLSSYEQYPSTPDEFRKTTDRSELTGFLQPLGIARYLPNKWWEDPFGMPGLPKDGIEENPKEPLQEPTKFNKKSANKITNFNPSTDTLEIDTDSFGINGSATFASGKNKKKVKKKLAKQDFDFLYDEKKGGLYFNENGSDKGFGDGGIIAIFKGAPDLTVSNLEFI